MSWVNQVNKYRKQLITPGSRCAWCGAKDRLTIDHLIPRSVLLKMGYTPMETWELERNLVVVCKDCNDEKASTICLKLPETHEALKEIMKKNPPTL